LRSALPDWWRCPSGGQAMATSGRITSPSRLWLWFTAMISTSTDMMAMLKNRLHMLLYLTNVLLAATCLYSK
jgi:hypothetical protein